MSWLSRSFANSLGIDDEGEHNSQHDHDVSRNDHNIYNKSSFSDRLNRNNRSQENHEEEDEDQSSSVTVNDDLSEFKETLTRQFLGVANFLSPPLPPPPPPTFRSDQITVSELDPSISGNDGESGDPTAVGDRDRDRAVLDNFQVNTIYDKLGSKVEEPDWIYNAVGLRDEVLSFAGNIAHHPETWLDFPIEEEDDLDDFDMSESQKEHAIAIEALTPRLRALRIELCPAHMSVGYFWKVYFVLLHSRLNKHDAELLSTSQVVEARAKWMHELQKRNKEELERQRYYKENAFPHDDFGPSSPCFQQADNYSFWPFSSEPASSSIIYDSETKNHTITSSETEFVDKSVILENPVVVEKSTMGVLSPKLLLHSFDDDEDDDDWPEDESLDDGKGVATIPLGIEEEVSFSDLDDDDCSIHAKYNISLKSS